MMNPEKISEIKQNIESKNGAFKTVFQETTISKGKNTKRWFVEYVCDKGHENKKRIDTLNIAWCYECTKNTVNDAHKLAENLGWKFLSEKYINANTKYKWQCKNGHIIEMTYGNAYSGKGCKKCLMRSLDDIRKKAEEKGGQCLSTEYTKLSDKYKFKCKNGHEWETTGTNILIDHWCPECNISVNERACKKILEFIYKRPFEKQRPIWLVTDKGNRLELDAYNDELKIALEYNGMQHYEMVPYFNKTHQNFEDRKIADKLKEKLCKDNGVYLIIVPYTVKYYELYTYIKNLCINLPNNTPENIDYSVLNLIEYKSEKKEEIQKYINEKYGGGDVLSNYVNNYTHIRFRCKNDHEFQQTWAVIKSGSFCKDCTYNKYKELMFPKIQSFCEENKIIMLGEYKKAKTPILWKCNVCNKQFMRTWDTLRIKAHCNDNK